MVVLQACFQRTFDSRTFRLLSTASSKFLASARNLTKDCRSAGFALVMSQPNDRWSGLLKDFRTRVTLFDPSGAA